ncbi:uncharacterized protein [Bemisia tabaci]|uniref:uncharacterized protein isoform X1 n=1 Tax=Bemisia tabaci TaxID=7038 RepID=UPI003B27E189
MSILRVIQPWIKQYLNAHLIDPTVHLIEEQLEARKSIDIDALTKYHNQTTAKIFKHLAKELSEYLPADSFTFSDDSSFQSRKKELKKLQNQLLKSSSSSEDDGVYKEDKQEISTQTENRACLTLKPLHKLVENEPMHDDIILNADLAATPSKKKHKKKRKENADAEPECSSTAGPVINLVEEEEEDGDCPAGSSKKKKHKKKERSISEAESSHGVDCYSDLLDQSKIGSKNDESQPILKLFMEFLKHMESLSEEKKNKFIKDVYQILRTAGSTQIECDNEENISPTDYHKLKKKKRKKSHNSESGPDDVPQEIIYLDITHDHNYGDTLRKPQKRKKDKRYEESFETEDGSGEKKKRKNSHCESLPTNIEDNVNPTEALLSPSESSKKKKKKKKKNLEDETSASEVTYLPGDAFNLPESEKDSQRQDSFHANSSRSNNINSAHCDILGSVINQEAGDSSERKDAPSRPTSHSSQKSLIDRRLSCESGSSKITRTLRTDDFLHELNPSYDSDSDSNGGSSVLLLSHVMGDEVAIKEEPLSPDFAERGLSNSVNSANFVKSPSRKQSRKAKSSSSSSGAVGSASQSNVLNEFLIMPPSTNDFSLSKTFDEQDMIDQMEDSEDEESENLSSTHDERQNESTGITLNTFTNPLSIPVTIPSVDTSAKQIELNDCRSLEKELLELEQCLVYAEKGTRDDQQPSTSQGPREFSSRWTQLRVRTACRSTPLKFEDEISEKPDEDSFKCVKCEQSFEEKSEFVKHWLHHIKKKFDKKSKDSNKQSYRCKACGSVFTEKSSLKSHSMDICGKTKLDSSYPCSVCAAGFKSENKLKRHMKTHDRTNLHYCTMCDYSSYKKSRLLKHFSSHSDLRPFKCSFCDNTFKTKNCLEVHCASVHSTYRPFKCKSCPAEFARKYTLIQHENIHSNLRRYVCIICGDNFRQYAALNNHQRRHTELKPFKCEVCEKAFKTKPELKQHLPTHSDEKPFSCDLCNYSSRWKGNVQKHFRTIHIGSSSTVF